MRYQSDRKERTRAAILEAAARAFREEGLDAVGVSDIMRRVGLTHGGFYAHFESKDALVSEACARALEGSPEAVLAPTEGEVADEESVIRRYLSRSHRDDPTSGCVIPAVAGDVPRQSPEVRHAFTESVQAYVDRLRPVLPPHAAPDEGWALLGAMAGTLLLARSVDDPELSDRILLAGRDFALRAVRSAATADEVAS